jgi:ABC-type glycerol-3-phosphate transport system permease component
LELLLELGEREFDVQFWNEIVSMLAKKYLFFSMLVPITAFLFLQRYVVAGLTAGSPL